jgi:hypothetical protein
MFAAANRQFGEITKVTEENNLQQRKTFEFILIFKEREVNFEGVEFSPAVMGQRALLF